MKKIGFLAAATFILILIGIYSVQPILLKAVIGTARVITTPVEAVVRIDGEPQSSARCFHVGSSFDGSPSDYFILWLPNPNANYGRDVLFIDRMHDDVGLPNASDRDYQLFWNSVLFQSESGSKYVSFGRSKFEPFDLHLELADQQISFVMPESPILRGKRVEISFN